MRWMLSLVGAGLLACGPSAAEVDEQWAQVRSWVTVNGPVGRPVFGGGLDEASPSADRPTAVQKVFDAFTAGSDWTTSPESMLPAAYRANIDRILKWGQAPRFEGTCAQPALNPIEIFDRLRLAIATADAKGLERVKSAVRVALGLRHAGHLLHATISAYIILDAIKWAKRYRVPFWPELKMPLTAEDYVRGMTIDAVCALNGLKNLSKTLKTSDQIPDAKTFKHVSFTNLAPLQIKNPSFTKLRAALRTQTRPTSPAFAATMFDSRASTLDLYEKLAREHAEAIAP